MLLEVIDGSKSHRVIEHANDQRYSANQPGTPVDSIVTIDNKLTERLKEFLNGKKTNPKINSKKQKHNIKTHAEAFSISERRFTP